MKTNGFHSLLFALSLLTISMVYSQNIITDGDFNLTTELRSDFDGPPPVNTWFTFQNVFQNYEVKARASVVNQQLKYQILSSGNHIPDVQLIQYGFSLKPGHSYKLSFDVKADADRTFGVFLGENGGNWASHLGYNNYTQNATTEWRNISIEFNVFTVFPELKLSFEFGTINTNVYLDNVELIDLGVIKESAFAGLSTLDEGISNPGFRPESELDRAFIDSYKESKFIIYPTISRTPNTTTWSASLSEGFAQNLKSLDDLDISLSKEKLNPGELKGKAQFQFFQNDMESLGSELKEIKKDTDYYIIPEILFEPQRNGTLFVFGIHVFILNSEGENVFSYLLNSHHELFLDAKLFAYNPFESDVEGMKKRSLAVAAKAFKLMVKQTNAQGSQDFD
ncbi:carbohydrate binding domain-containing protein [Lentiprolixibacter aurantiacus]|uniref:Carbohydrate binding domain-containing protein n=1 Tax=Lentiprolixibacter aurantiacus TaxID=2993939 RepID=A0AAE3SMS2_9FLAO|nr:carbohydrate binding domain-containing protein [Lentiprolixibacter aurantiacus]MCX2718874.1 carbohydrate binding domain-containing protein [Lentiprolixibacter aurantiacus]